MEEGIFKQEDLRLCDWQYTIRHDNVDCFERGLVQVVVQFTKEIF